jgi:hypothetical protein
MALDSRIKKALNDLSRTQPAMRVAGAPGEQRILLGDILDEMISNTETVAKKLDLDTGVTDTDFEALSTGDDAATSELGR